MKAAQRAVALNNMREDAHRLIVQALAATGRKAEALKHYEDLAVLLKRELSTEPDAATKALVAELRSAKAAPPQPVQLPQPSRPRHRRRNRQCRNLPCRFPTGRRSPCWHSPT